MAALTCMCFVDVSGGVARPHQVLFQRAFLPYFYLKTVGDTYDMLEKLHGHLIPGLKESVSNFKVGPDATMTGCTSSLPNSNVLLSHLI
jgi:hypothetical protein